MKLVCPSTLLVSWAHDEIIAVRSILAGRRVRLGSADHAGRSSCTLHAMSATFRFGTILDRKRERSRASLRSYRPAEAFPPPRPRLYYYIRDGSPYLTARHEYLRCTHAQVMYIKKVRKLPMYGTTLFHVHNSKACLPAAWACHSY